MGEEAVMIAVLNQCDHLSVLRFSRYVENIYVLQCSSSR
jgi:hypothetical protein